jgi:Tfp pilus assembly protein PilN
MSINLLPWRERLARKRAQYYWFSLGISIISLMFITLAVRYVLLDLKDQYQARNLHWANLMSPISVTDAGKLSAEYRAMSEKIKFIESIELNQANFWRIYFFLQQKLPAAVQLTRLVWNPQELILQGQTQSSEPIAALVKALENNHLFSRVTLENLTQGEHNASIQFSILANQPYHAQ